jgi:hypothetical protein
MNMTSASTSKKHRHEETQRRLIAAEQREDRRREADKIRKALEDRQWSKKMKQEHEKDKRDDKLWKEQKHREKQLHKQAKHQRSTTHGAPKSNEDAVKPKQATVKPTEAGSLSATNTNGFSDAKPPSIGKRVPSPTYNDISQEAKERERLGITASKAPEAVVAAPGRHPLDDGEEKLLPTRHQEQMAKDCRRFMSREPIIHEERCCRYKKQTKVDLKEKNRQAKISVKDQYDDCRPYRGLPTWWHTWVSTNGPYRTARRENAAQVGSDLNQKLVASLETTRENVNLILEHCLSQGVPRALIMKGYVDHLKG